MKAITIESVRVLDEALQNEVHHTFGMEHYTDYVFKPREDKSYSATMVMEESEEVIRNIETRSSLFPEHEFVIEELDMETNSVREYRIRNGKILEVS